MSEANEGMKKAKKAMPDIETVHQMLDDIAEHQDDLSEVQEAISRDISSTSDEDLERELSSILTVPANHSDSIDGNVDDLLKGLEDLDLKISCSIPPSEDFEENKQRERPQQS